MKPRILIAILACVLFGGMCVMENAAVRGRPKCSGEHVSSIYALAGEFRTVFANVLWVKADEYHHEYLKHGNDWTRNKELLGLLDLIIMLDPQFVDAYANKAYIYLDADDDIRKALKVLRQGISNNPRSRELYEITAVVYARRAQDPIKALPYARKAVLYAEDNWYRTRSQRLLRTIARMANEEPRT